MNDIVTKIYTLLAQSGMSKGCLGEKIGVSRNTIINWKKLNSYPSLQVIENICNVFNITVEQFFTGIGKVNTESEKFLQEWRILSDDEKSAINSVISTFKKLRK